MNPLGEVLHTCDVCGSAMLELNSNQESEEEFMFACGTESVVGRNTPSHHLIGSLEQRGNAHPPPGGTSPGDTALGADALVLHQTADGVFQVGKSL